MVLLRTAPGVSRIHASRRVFDILKKHDIQVPVIHHQWCVPAKQAALSVNDPQHALPSTTCAQQMCAGTTSHPGLPEVYKVLSLYHLQSRYADLPLPALDIKANLASSCASQVPGHAQDGRDGDRDGH